MLGGERGIRTPGASQLNGFQDRRNRPLCHLSGRKSKNNFRFCQKCLSLIGRFLSNYCDCHTFLIDSLRQAWPPTSNASDKHGRSMYDCKLFFAAGYDCTVFQNLRNAILTICALEALLPSRLSVSRRWRNSGP